MRSASKHLALTLLFVGSTRLIAQGPGGTVTGRILDRASGNPIAGASVGVAGTLQNSRSGEDGRYRIANVAPGAHQLRVTRLGYAAESQPISVVAAQENLADFRLTQSAVKIDEVVVTATGEEQRKRESGSSVSTVDVNADKLQNKTTLSQLLTAAAPGVYVNSAGGTVGSAARVRIRGSNSVSLSNEPLVVIDGVRANNEINGAGSIGVGGQVSTRINDINPDDIESVEIIKGPAAAALYGTAAASGVIQIRTRRGHGGVTRWELHSEEGSQSNFVTFPSNFGQIGRRTSNGSRTTACTLDQQTRNICTAFPDSLVNWNPLVQASPFITGYRSSNGGNVSGGTDAVNYFISGDYDRDQGVVNPNKFSRVGLRGNLSSQLTRSVTTQLSTNYLSSRLAFPQNDNNILGIISGGLLGNAFDDPTSHGYLAGQVPQDLFAIDVRESVERFVGSNLTTWQPLPWLTATATAGVDFVDRRNLQTVPANRVFFNSSYVDGWRQANTTQLWTYTANGNLTGVKNISSNLTSSTTAGLAFNRDLVQGTQAYGAKLLAGTGSLQGTAARFQVGEFNTDNRTLGALIREQLAWRDRLFLTGAIRTDKNSAFGANAGWVYYPAVSVSYVVSEEPFFPRTNYVSSLRLRTAYGESGRQPNFRDAITFYNAQTVTSAGADIPGIVVGGTGNTGLKPEKAREYEVGFEAGLLDNRVSLDFTTYNKHARDLLIARPLPPSLGLTNTQFVNLGESSNTGVEVQLNARVFEVKNARLDVTVNGSTNTNKLLKLGTLANGSPIPPVVFGEQRHVEGYPLGGYWDVHYTFQDLNNDGVISRVNCPGQTQVAGGPACEITLDTLSYLGQPFPTREFSVNPRLTVMKNIEIGALIDYHGGHQIYNLTNRFRCAFGNCEESYNKNTPLWIQARDIAQSMGTDAGYIENADFTKLREVTVALTLPREWATRARAASARLTFAGRNLKTWTKYTGIEPEVNATPGVGFTTWDFLTQPPLRVFSARLTLSF